MLGLVLAMGAICGGCGGPPSMDPGDDGDDDGAAGGELPVEGTFVGLDGVRVIATAGSIDAPVHLEVTAVPAPVAEPFGDLAMTGRYYRIAAERDVRSPADSPFAIGLPVPEGVDATHVVVAALASTADMLDGDPAPRNVWLPRTGLYDPGTHSLFVTLRRIPTTGSVFVIATSPGVTTRENSATGGSLGVTHIAMLAHDFYVNCWGFPNDECPGTTQAEMALEMADARRILLDAGYPEPALELELKEIGIMEARVVGIGYVVNVVPDGHDKCFVRDEIQGGVYYDDDSSLWVCLQEGTTTLPTSAADHELFHSVQFAFPNVAGSGQTSLIEGSAAVAMASIHEIGLHRVMDVPAIAPMHLLDTEMLTRDYPIVYRSQDLWVYIGRVAGAGLEYLVPVFESDMTTNGISSATPGGDLKQSYFDMAMNNLIEKHELYDDFLQHDCVFDSFIFFNDPLDTWELTEPPPGGDLAPLTTTAFQRQFFDFPFVHASNSSGDPNIRLAIYEEGSCERLPDNFRALDGKQYYFVFVNTSLDQTAHWQVDVKTN